MCIRDRVKLVSTCMGQTTTRDMTEETFREQYGFAPIHMIDLKALMGDASDTVSYTHLDVYKRQAMTQNQP